ncbi:GHMP kinase [uncultured Selenomonas sp.]|uniref:GHMP family kinase ATP-binding protein n=1 Tax=uncultured Selenomonas sp. TaxID=159275 RepID=UPI0025F125F7|nr:GHMP kinase [uncultured Selenomonas sp.]
MDMTVRVPGSCGELVQGWMDGEPFLVTCPIEMYTTVRVSDRIEGLHGLGRKSLRALELTLEFFGKESFPWGMELTSELPHGKGMASSSADIAAVAAATGLAFGRALTPQEILAIAVRIEPTDGVFFPSVVRMNQVTGTILEAYPAMPRFAIAVFDTGGTVDTVALHRSRSSLADGRRRAIAERPWCDVFPLLQQDAVAVARAATQSAAWQDDVLPKPQFLPFVDAAKRAGALGVCAAHSGTVLGALFPPELPEPAVERAVACIRADVPALAFLCRTRLRPGGIDVS